VVSNAPDDAELERLLIQLLRVMGPATSRAASGRPANGAANDDVQARMAEVPAAGVPAAAAASAGVPAADAVTSAEVPAADAASAGVPAAGVAAAEATRAGTTRAGTTRAGGSAAGMRADDGRAGDGSAGDRSAADGSAVDGPPADARSPELPAVSASEARALIELVTARGIAQGELARLLGLEKSTVSRLAAGLERKGWIRRGRDSDNQRYVRLYLTPEGREVAARVWRAWQSRPARILAALSDDERAGLSSGLRGLVRGLAAEGLLGGAGPG
jgi:DNA-binding MarR family transcriptional regulator